MVCRWCIVKIHGCLSNNSPKMNGKLLFVLITTHIYKHKIPSAPIHSLTHSFSETVSQELKNMCV